MNENQPNFLEVREAHESLAGVGINVSIVDKHILTIANLDQKPMRVTRAQARALAKALTILADVST